MAKKKRINEVEKWLGHIQAYDRSMSKWEARAKKIIDRYRDDHGPTRGSMQAHFNILWSNVQTLSAATFAKLPKPDVSRRFRDNDPIGRIASLMLERALEYEIQHYKDYRFAMKASVLDRFLPGRGTSWVRYEPHFRAVEQQLPEDGVQVTENIDEPQEELDYECAPVDYVHWKDFGHVLARIWDEVTGVWRKVYMTRDALVSRFGEELGNKIPLDAIPEEFKQKQQQETDLYRGLVYEIWDKEKKEAVWIAKSLGTELDRRPDPLGLEEFFPCPKPLYATLTNESLEPVPDFTLYQDQARDLDILCDRIDGLVKALQVKGCYDASQGNLARLFTEGENTNLIPVKNWASFSEKQGLKGSIDMLDLKPIYEALVGAYGAMEQIKQQVYEITGISDIVRGQGDPSATATAEQLKGQYANLRLKAYQEQVAEYAAEAIQIKAQIICNKFGPDTILSISAADQIKVTDADVLAVMPQLGQAPQQPQIPGMPPQPPAPPPIAMMPEEAKRQIVYQAALKLLIGDRLDNPDAQTANPMRSFRIEIESDSLVYLDDQQNKQSRMEFLIAQGNFIGQMEKILATAGPMAAPLMPVMMEMWKFSAQAFKVGKGIEGSIDEAAEKIKEIAKRPPAPPPPDPAVIKGQMDLERAKIENQAEMQLAPVRAQTERVKAQAEGMKAEASMVDAQMSLEESRIRAANPQAFQAPQRPQ